MPQVHAFTLDSLLKLKDAKAFDQKTTIMQYLVRLIMRHDPEILDFKHDLKRVPKASRYNVLRIAALAEILAGVECAV